MEENTAGGERGWGGRKKIAARRNDHAAENEGINEEQRCRVAVCEGVGNREGEAEERSEKRTGPTGVCKETSQALIGNLVDCQLQTNRKSGASQTRSCTSPVGKAKPRHRTPANLGIFRQCGTQFLHTGPTPLPRVD